MGAGLFQSTLPVWGATVTVSLLHFTVSYFNPRSPCGERPHRGRPGVVHLVRFQSTLPVWGATLVTQWHRAPVSEFQSTLPVWGATARSGAGSRSSRFQSTLPVWGATGPISVAISLDGISIHAPRVGSDCPARPPGGRPSTYFNPRSPCGERLRDYFKLQRHYKFQSTLPVWGATLEPRA